MKLLRSKKGFTLMEIIVVLIIIAIMAAALIPSFVNFARNARANEYIAQARVGMTAAQAFMTDEGARALYDADQLIQVLNYAMTTTTGNTYHDKFVSLLSGDVANEAGFGAATLAGVGEYRVGSIKYSVDGLTTQAGWRIHINDTAATTEFWRPSGTPTTQRGSEGNLWTNIAVVGRPAFLPTLP